MVALLRGINVAGKSRALRMADLRSLCGELGWTGVATYIQSGNVVFEAAGKPAELEAKLEEAILDRYGMKVPVVVRTGAQWAKLVASNPFKKVAREEPNRLQLVVSKRPPDKDAPGTLIEKADAGEAVKAVPGGLWLHYPQGVGRSKLTPSIIDRFVGSPATSRNHRTVVKLKEMLES